MGKRSDFPDLESDIAKLTLEELNAEIARCKTRMKIAPTAHLHKAFFKRIVLLETKRESLFGVARPKRTLRAR